MGGEGGGRIITLNSRGLVGKYLLFYYGRVNINYTCISLEISSLRLTIEQRHDTEAAKSKLLAIGSFNCSKDLDFGKNTTCIRYIISRNRTRNFTCYGYWFHRLLLGTGAGFKGSTTKTAHVLHWYLGF